jgi:transposase
MAAGRARSLSDGGDPTLEQEDAKRSNREHQYLVGERTRVINRLKAALARLGVRNFNPKLRKASERLRALVTPEGKSLPPNTLAEMERDMQRLQFVRQQIKAIEQTRFERLKKDPNTRLNMMVLLVARVFGMGIETADMLVHEVLSRDLRDRRAVARYAGLTGSPDESGARRREKGLARAGNARVRRGMIEFAWRFVRFQKDSTLAQWFRAHRRCARSDPQNHDRGAGSQAAHCSVAACHDRRDTHQSHAASGRVSFGLSISCHSSIDFGRLVG